MPNGWLQHCDYSSELLDLHGYDDFLRVWQRLDIAKMDADMRDAEQGGRDFCAWGIGINMDDSKYCCGLHVYREDVELGTFTVCLQKIKKTPLATIFGFQRSKCSYRQVDNAESLLEIVRQYYLDQAQCCK